MATRERGGARDHKGEGPWGLLIRFSQNRVAPACSHGREEGIERKKKRGGEVYPKEPHQP